MAQQLRALTVPLDDTVGVLAPTWQLTTVCSLSSRGSDAFFWISDTRHACGIHICLQPRTHTHKSKILRKQNKTKLSSPFSKTVVGLPWGLWLPSSGLLSRFTVPDLKFPARKLFVASTVVMTLLYHWAYLTRQVTIVVYGRTVGWGPLMTFLPQQLL